MNRIKIIFLSFVVISISAFSLKNVPLPNGDDPWSAEQLMEPSELAKIINEGNQQNIYIFNIGPAGSIKNSIEIGSGRDEKSIKKLKEQVSKLPKDASIVIYCGCCPFVHCPNIRPAFQLLNDMEFTNHRLLNLSQNLKADWIDKGYPMEE